MKHMTLKEFIESIDNSGLGYKFYKFEGILNMLVDYHFLKAEKEDKMGYNISAKVDRSIAHNIYESLRDRDYYDK